MSSRAMGCLAFFLCGCGGGSTIDDAGSDASARDGGLDAAAAITDAAIADAGDSGASDAGPSCLDEHTAGERFPAGDGCNFCDCLTGGSTSCTTRTCRAAIPGCTYDGVEHAYAERFPSTDGCNECVCAASGLACTRRSCPGALEEGAILVESLDEECGVAGFTARSVIEGLPHDDLVLPFLYDRARALYPETRPDTTVHLRIVYDGGFAACRIPMAGQEAFDIEVLVEWTTADGAFDEGFRAYLRRNAGGFVDAWWVDASLPVGGLSGAYDPACLDPGGFAFHAQIDAAGSANGGVTKICETDIALDVGTFERQP